jgi:hypothetical protein
VLYVGGNYNQNQNYGLFYLNGNNTASDSNGSLGGRLLVEVSYSARRNPWARMFHTSKGVKIRHSRDGEYSRKSAGKLSGNKNAERGKT